MHCCVLIFQLGDEILEGNGRAFPRLTHDEAVRILKCSHSFDLVVRHIAKVPHSSSMSGSDTCDLVCCLLFDCCKQSLKWLLHQPPTYPPNTLFDCLNLMFYREFIPKFFIAANNS